MPRPWLGWHRQPLPRVLRLGQCHLGQLVSEVDAAASSASRPPRVGAAQTSSSSCRYTTPARQAVHIWTEQPLYAPIRGTFSVYEMRSTGYANGHVQLHFLHPGLATHGYPSIPLYPASNGCLRLYDADADLVFSQVHGGERVAVF